MLKSYKFLLCAQIIALGVVCPIVGMGQSGDQLTVVVDIHPEDDQQDSAPASPVFGAGASHRDLQDAQQALAQLSVAEQNQADQANQHNQEQAAGRDAREQKEEGMLSLAELRRFCLDLGVRCFDAFDPRDPYCLGQVIEFFQEEDPFFGEEEPIVGVVRFHSMRAAAQDGGEIPAPEAYVDEDTKEEDTKEDAKE